MLLTQNIALDKNMCCNFNFFTLLFFIGASWQVTPYYDYEDVIDSDEELDLASMAPDAPVGYPLQII